MCKTYENNWARLEPAWKTRVESGTKARVQYFQTTAYHSQGSHKVMPLWHHLSTQEVHKDNVVKQHFDDELAREVRNDDVLRQYMEHMLEEGLYPFKGQTLEELNDEYEYHGEDNDFEDWTKAPRDP